ncbi:MAG: TolC family outer membrane protein [Oleiphilaceae bacterium]|nr:TolC family outer membrane protein [Oleiphilaceae bacterium]
MSHFSILWRTLLMIFVCLYASKGITGSLEAVVQESLSTNPQVRFSFSALKSAYYQDKSSIAGFLPTLRLSGDYGREYTDNDQRSSTDMTRRQARLQLRQPLYRGGQSAAESSRTRATFMSASYRVKEASENFGLEIVENYLNVLKAKELVLLAQENLDMHYNIKQKVDDRHEQGVGDKADIAQINGRISRAEANLNNARNELMDTRSRYISLVGSLSISMNKPQADKSYIPDSRSQAQSVALANNPTILLSTFDVKAAQAQYKSRKSGYYPQVDLVIDGGQKKNVSGFNGEEEDASAVVELNWNLFNGTRDVNEAKAYYYKVEEAQMISNNARRQVMERIDLIWGGYLRDQRNIEVLREYVVSAKQAETLYNSQFQVNRRSLLDLLDSSNELFEARKSYLDTEYSLLTDQYRLMHIQGFLLESMRINIEKTIKEEVER